jgi:DNA-binding NtrC family response regulator
MAEAAATILIVEDEEIIRDLFAEFLSAAGYLVLSAESSEEALQVSQTATKPINLLLADINLAGQMNGFQLSECLSQRYPALKIVYMSGFFAEEDAFGKYIQRPGRGFLQKPFQLPILLDMITDLLR